MAKTRITGLEVHEVSLVANPANKPSQITLFKSASKPMKEQINRAGDKCRLCDTAVNKDDNYCRGCGAPFYKSEEKMDEKKTDPVAKQDEKVETPPAPAPAPEPAAADLHKAEIEKRDAKLAEEIAKRAALEAENAELKKNAKLVAKKEQVAKSMAAVPVEKDALADKLLALAEKDAELAKFVEDLLEKCSTAIAQSDLLTRKSDPAADAVNVSDAEKQLEKMARDLAKAEGITFEKAYTKVIRENAKLYSDYLEQTKQ